MQLKADWHSAVLTVVSACALLLHYGAPLPRQPKIKKIMHITRNRKNRNLAIPAEAAAIPPNPSTAATIAIIRKTTAQLSISHLLSFTKESNQSMTVLVFRLKWL